MKVTSNLPSMIFILYRKMLYLCNALAFERTMNEMLLFLFLTGK